MDGPPSLSPIADSEASGSESAPVQANAHGGEAPGSESAGVQAKVHGSEASCSESAALRQDDDQKGNAVASGVSCSSGASRTRGRTLPAHEGPWADGLGDASPWALMGTYCFNAPDPMPAAVAPRVLVGSVLHATAVHMLRSIGVTMVINVAAAQCRVPMSEFEAAGIEYHALEAKDEEGYPILEQHYPTVHALLKPVLGGQGRALVHCVAGRNRSVTLAVAAVMLHERRPLPLIARRAFQRRPFILTNMSFRRQLSELARVHNLLEVKPNDVPPTDAGGSTEQLCPHCGQPHIVNPSMRLDGRLCVDTHTFTVAALHLLLQRRFGCENLNVDYETEASNKDAKPPSAKALLPSGALALPLIAFSLIAFADLPIPIRGKLSPSHVRREVDEPIALMTVFDTRRKVLLTIGVHDSPGLKGSRLALDLSLNT